MTALTAGEAVRLATLPTPTGPLHLAGDGSALIGCWFGDPDALIDRLQLSEPARRVDDLGELSKAVSAYLGGDLKAIDDLPVRQPGSAFLQDCWDVMRAVPAGETISYAELAARAGRPKAVRAAGTACGRNRVALVVPCHRIIRSMGGLGGYAYGMDAKRWLLAHEMGQDRR